MAIALLTIAAPTDATEGDSSSKVFRFVVTRSGNTVSFCSATWLLSGTVDSADLAPGQATSGTVSFLSGVTSRNIDISIAGDTTIEANETLTIEITNPVDCILVKQPTNATVTSVTDDYQVTITPATDFVGDIVVPYRVKNSAGATKDAVITVTVTAVAVLPSNNSGLLAALGVL